MQKKMLLNKNNGLGCSSKINFITLNEITEKINIFNSPNLLIGFKNMSDSGIYKINKQYAIVQSVDFIKPIVDNPFLFGEIAVANALNDIYASNSIPLTAMNIVCFPDNEEISILDKILEGASKKLIEAETVLLGGHSIYDETIKFGLAVTGKVKINDFLTNSNAKIGDHLVLTKPIGTGIITTALKKGIKLNCNSVSECTNYMKMLHNGVLNLFNKYNISSCTDISGFSLIGHAIEMAKASKTSMVVYSDRIPIFEGVNEISESGALNKETLNNFIYFKNEIIINKTCQLNEDIIFDSQTSGGLLISINPNESDKLIKELKKMGFKKASIIGEVIKKKKFNIIVK